MGDKHDPCGVPALNSTVSDHTPSWQTLRDRLSRKEKRMFFIWRESPILFILYLRPFFQTASNAAFTSKNRPKVQSLLLKLLEMLCESRRRCSWVDLPLVNPAWLALRKFFSPFHNQLKSLKVLTDINFRETYSRQF